MSIEQILLIAQVFVRCDEKLKEPVNLCDRCEFQTRLLFERW